MEEGLKFVIRKAEKKDATAMLKLIRELAVFEKAPDAVINTVELMEKEGFGTKPLFDAFVAESEARIVGLSLCYYRYSTWKGKRLYLEDLIVTERYRGNGIGKALFEESLKFAKNENCTGMTWQVLDWNIPALDFYKKYGSEFDNGWLNANVDFD